MAQIEIHDVTKVYNPNMKKGGIMALDTVSFTLHPAEILGLLGPNGAGKTTLFKVILNLTPASNGNVTVLGRPSTDYQARQRVGYLPENHRFPQHHTARTLLQLSGSMYGMRKDEIEHRIPELLVLVDMEKWADTPIRKFSKGMLQRTGLAQALISDPDILLLDEPTDGVDPVGKVEILQALSRLRDQGKAIILNSHLLSEVESVADRVVVLSRGKVARIGTVAEFTSRGTQYLIEAEFGDMLIDLDPEIGRVLSISSNRLMVELTKLERINDIIDMLRIKRVPIRSVQPMKVSLEQSFMEVVTGQPQQVSSGDSR
jgi:ABC-2 type transport system ATP-binding protein